MAKLLNEALAKAAEAEARAWNAQEEIYALLGWPEFPPGDVIEAVDEAVEMAALSAGEEEPTIRARDFSGAIEKLLNEARYDPLRDTDVCPECGDRVDGGNRVALRACHPLSNGAAVCAVCGAPISAKQTA